MDLLWFLKPHFCWFLKRKHKIWIVKNISCSQFLWFYLSSSMYHEWSSRRWSFCLQPLQVSVSVVAGSIVIDSQHIAHIIFRSYLMSQPQRQNNTTPTLKLGWTWKLLWVVYLDILWIRKPENWGLRIEDWENTCVSQLLKYRHTYFLHFQLNW